MISRYLLLFGQKVTDAWTDGLTSLVAIRNLVVPPLFRRKFLASPAHDPVLDESNIIMNFKMSCRYYLGKLSSNDWPY